MPSLSRFFIPIKALTQLPYVQIWNYLVYKAGLFTGIYKLKTPLQSRNQVLTQNNLKINWFMQLPEKAAFFDFGEGYIDQVKSEGDEIASGFFRIFGADKKPLTFAPEVTQKHWSSYEKKGHTKLKEDIKNIWEPARFTWAVKLAKAFYFSMNGDYFDSYIDYYTRFKSANPVNSGRNWQSGQEVALRLINQIITLHLFRESSKMTAEFLEIFARDLADHADRVYATLAYAKAQANNHLISEAVGLYSAGEFLPNHPRAVLWKKAGLHNFTQAISSQIDKEGEYCQHSTNYHRLMLKLALWMHFLVNKSGEKLPEACDKKLASATKWLAGQIDIISGKTPNLGHNDGADVLPLNEGGFDDYRPVLQASFRAFLGKSALASGPWDDLSIWLSFPTDPVLPESLDFYGYWPKSRIGRIESWASMRAKTYRNRPAHADQLNVEVWHKGINIALDAGTYLYNANPPWDNRLSSTCVHNTVTINQTDQMTRAGRFMWLDWSKAKVVASHPQILNGMHDGYLKQGVLHKRRLEALQNGWSITDKIFRVNGKKNAAIVQIQWLLPDWQYILDGNSIFFQAPFGQVQLSFFTEAGILPDGLNIIRAGKSLTNKNESPIHGWYSPTYGSLLPALSIIYTINELLPVEITSRFNF